MGITRIATRYDATGDVAGPFANVAKFRSLFWGPATCGAGGCASFDVYFSTMQAVAVAPGGSVTGRR